MREKIVSSFLFVLMITYVFSISYFVDESSGYFETSENYFGESSSSNFLLNVAKWFMNKLKYPVFGFVSAEEIGCCAVAKTGEQCVTANEGNCVEGVSFAPKAVCLSTSFCKPGCCFDSKLGIYEKGVTQSSCSKEWIPDQFCNVPAAKLGCCVLDRNVKFETEGACKVDTQSLALGKNSVVDWRGNLNEAQCIQVSLAEVEGACVLGGGDCKFVKNEQCKNLGGSFNEGILCTSEFLDTGCKPTEKTTCVPGKDGVYFLDSCGNVANIYDSTKAKEQDYWNNVKAPEESCNADNKDGNANSASCGNCDRFLGGICASSVEKRFDVEMGDNYCRPTSCEFEGNHYENGESWCDYDGYVGDGKDVVGSVHWRYNCNQGVVSSTSCGDYRNAICVQGNLKDFEGKETDITNSACIPNNAITCLNLNNKKDGIEECADTLNCKVEHVDVSDKFDLNVCVPKYPKGFDLKDERFAKTSEAICNAATVNCTVVYEPGFFGGCKLKANEECLGETFAQKMNNFCTSLGDCGAKVNYVGNFQENYKVRNSPKLSIEWIAGLKKYAERVPGQFAEVEDYTPYLEAAGIIQTNVGDGGKKVISGINLGLSGVLGLTLLTKGSVSFIATEAGFTAFGGAAVGAAVGAVAGIYLAKELGLSSFGTILMATGGAIVGAFIGYAAVASGPFLTTLLAIPVYGWIIAVVLIIASLFFVGGSCDPIEVQFECKVWQPPKGGAECEKCNGDPFKPCSKYRCETLGATCEIVNEGTKEEKCVNVSPNDVVPPTPKPMVDAVLPGTNYTEITDKGFRIISSEGECVPAYTPVVIGIQTDEVSLCKFGSVAKSFDELEFDLGGNFYLNNHTTVFPLIDPSHGQSKGLNWNGELSLYVLCQDRNGNVNPNPYVVDMCVKQGSDITAPAINLIEPASGSIVSFEATTQKVKIVTNELSTCKWDVSDKDYSSMINSMDCGDDLFKPTSPMGYVCSDEFGITSKENNYYVRCMDQPWLIGTENESKRAENKESVNFVLKKPEKKIEIVGIRPNSEIRSPSEIATVNLEIDTASGGAWHKCSYSFSGFEKMIELFETGADRTHKQSWSLNPGSYKIYAQCVDETGDFDQKTTEFEIVHDESTPLVSRIWQSSGQLNFVTSEVAVCKYSTESCNFDFKNSTDAGTGINHFIKSNKGIRYYVKCEDDFGNVPIGCSAVMESA